MRVEVSGCDEVRYSKEEWSERVEVMRECNVETGKVEIVAVSGAIFYGHGMLEFVRTEAACDRHLIGVFSLVQSRNLGSLAICPNLPGPYLSHRKAVPIHFSGD